MLSILSNLFEYRAGAKYTIEARNGGVIQVIGLSFFGGDFFSGVPIEKLE